MNKKELVNAVQGKIEGLTKKEVESVIEAFVETIEQTVAEGEKVSILNFGSFEPRARAEHKGRNPQTQEELTIEATIVPAFKSGKRFKNLVKNSLIK